MPYSVVWDVELVQPVQNHHPTIDGGANLQQVGNEGIAVLRVHWASTPQLQAIIDSVVPTYANSGWGLANKPNETRVPILEPLDLYNMVIAFKRFTA